MTGAMLSAAVPADPNRTARQELRFAAGLLILCTLPAVTCAQGGPQAPVRAQQGAVRLADDLAELRLTEEQKAQIRKIERDMKTRMDKVNEDEKLDPEQKWALLRGYRLMESNQVFKVLTPEQQAEVRKRDQARREAADREQQQKQHLPQR